MNHVASPSRLPTVLDRQGLSNIDSWGLNFLGVSEEQTVPVVIKRQPLDWAVFPIEQDPSYLLGEMHVPAKVVTKLQTLERRGVEFDSLWLAHELLPGYDEQLVLTGQQTQFYLPQPKPSKPTPLLAAPAPIQVPQQPSRPIGQTILSIAKPVAAGIAIVLAAPLMLLGLMVIGAAGSVDPILLGGIEIEPGRFAYFEIARWDVELGDE